MAIKKIGILTSGGDAPGMNNVIRAVGRFALKNGINVAIIADGFKGLVENQIKNATEVTFTNIINRGGTMLGSSRLPEFKNVKVRLQAIKNLQNHNINALVVIGGDGSFKGALKLSREGIITIGVPGTIDNDINSTEYSIGFDTALNTIVSAVDKLRDTANSHMRCSLVEVMGRDCGDLAFYSSIAGGVEAVSTSEHPLTEAEIIKKVLFAKKLNKRHCIVIVSEHLYNVSKLAKKIAQQSGFETRATILGHIQRGGSPSSYDRILGARMGIKAVELIISGANGQCVCLKNNHLIGVPIEQALKMKKESRKNLANEALLLV